MIDENSIVIHNDGLVNKLSSYCKASHFKAEFAAGHLTFLCHS
jgi:hypothetical protein